MTTIEAPWRRVQPLKVSSLLLDDENPRLAPTAKGMSQDKLLELLDRDFELLPVAKSMSDNGYFAEEPLVVIPNPKMKGEYIVVEGNRRLAALKFLTDPEKRKLSHNGDIYEDLARSRKEDLTVVPAIVYESRDELVSLMGFRHLAGISKWEPLAKARFISQLVEKKGVEVDFAEIARETGISSSTIRSNYVAYRVYEQAKLQFEIDTRNLEEDFSVFFRALDNNEIQKFIGLDKKKVTPRSGHPIPIGKAEALRELVGFIFGTKEESPVMRDSRHLYMVAQVLASPKALNALRISRNLDLSFSLTGGEESRLIENLERASFYIDESLRDIHRHKENRKVADLVQRCMDSMNQILNNFPVIGAKLSGRQ